MCKLVDSPASFLINQGVMPTLQERRLGYHSRLPIGSRTRNLQILDPVYKPLRCLGDIYHISYTRVYTIRIYHAICQGIYHGIYHIVYDMVYTMIS
jgi:hypothetical protein